MSEKDLKINFRYLTGNIACMSVDSIGGKPVHNDINNEEAIILFNSLVGEKENCKTVKTLLEENNQLKKQLEYLRSGEYINQLKFERNMLEDIVQNSEISKEDKEFIDMTHRNTELLEENQLLKIQVSSREEVANKYKEVIDKAVDIAYEYGQIDGNHHKLWVIDQMLRALLNENYQNFIKDYEEDGKYTWDTGIAP